MKLFRPACCCEEREHREISFFEMNGPMKPLDKQSLQHLPELFDSCGPGGFGRDNAVSLTGSRFGAAERSSVVDFLP
jgi:hypothetical protein